LRAHRRRGRSVYLHYLRGALVGPVQCEEGYRVDALGGADALQEEDYGIFLEEAVEVDLSDLVNGEYKELYICKGAFMWITYWGDVVEELA